MKALTYDGKGKIKVVEKPIPTVESTADAVVKLLRTTICGTDLHIIKGDVPTVTQGRTLGHEGVGLVEEVGTEVKQLKKGDKVLIACITSCATCTFCKRSMNDQCKNGGWKLGHTNDGTQAEYVRIPYADANLYKVPDGLDEKSLLVLSDILPTGLEVCTIRGGVKPGDTVAIVGAGPVGLACALTAQLYSPRKIVFFDKDEARLEIARKIGATDCINPTDGNVRDLAKKHFGEIDGFDLAVEAVGVPETFQMCQDLVGIGGHIANVGVHGTKVSLDIDRLWPRSTTISMALVSAHTIPMLLELFQAGKIDTSVMITHDFKFDEVEKAYDVFGRAAETEALKVNIEFN
jgi:alcohol dehydrogenase